MRTITSIGEIGVTYQGDTYRFRPSLLNMDSLGYPKEIVTLFMSVMSASNCAASSEKLYKDALHVIYSCSSDDKDASHIFGYVDKDLRLVLGAAKPEDTITLARSLLMHGLIGDYPRIESDDDSEYTQSFNARDIVASAVAHLGVSESEAWDMTMTSFVGAIRAKFPEIQKKEEQQKQSKAFDEWADRYERERQVNLKSKGGNK